MTKAVSKHVTVINYHICILTLTVETKEEEKKSIAEIKVSRAES